MPAEKSTKRNEGLRADLKLANLSDVYGVCDKTHLVVGHFTAEFSAARYLGAINGAAGAMGRVEHGQ